MSLSYSSAKWLAPASFFIDFGAQLYGLLSSPNMKDINDANQSFFSPQPLFIGVFFFTQQVVQLGWLYRLYKLNPKKSVTERQEIDQMVDYVPYFALGHSSLAVWMVLWNSEHLDISFFSVAINTIAQIYYMIAKLPPMNTKSTSSILTSVVNKAFAGICVLDFLHNGSIAFFKDQPATTVVRVLTGVGFGLGAASSDWIFGGSLVYDLIAFTAGQSGSWRLLLGGYAIGASVIVVIKNTDDLIGNGNAKTLGVP